MHRAQGGFGKGVLCLLAPLQGDIGRGAFQELDQVKALHPFCKHAARASRCGGAKFRST